MTATLPPILCLNCGTPSSTCSWSTVGDLGRTDGGGDCCPGCVHPTSRDAWCTALLERADDPDAIWPEDVLSEDEWKRGWFDRQVLLGRMKPEERSTVECDVGGDLHGPWCTDACKPTGSGPAT